MPTCLKIIKFKILKLLYYSNYLIKGGDDSHIKIFSKTNLDLIKYWVAHEQEVTDIQVDSENNILFSCSYDGDIKPLFFDK